MNGGRFQSIRSRVLRCRLAGPGKCWASAADLIKQGKFRFIRVTYAAGVYEAAAPAVRHNSVDSAGRNRHNIPLAGSGAEGQPTTGRAWRKVIGSESRASRPRIGDTPQHTCINQFSQEVG